MYTHNTGHLFSGPGPSGALLTPGRELTVARLYIEPTHINRGPARGSGYEMSEPAGDPVVSDPPYPTRGHAYLAVGLGLTP